MRLQKLGVFIFLEVMSVKAQLLGIWGYSSVGSDIVTSKTIIDDFMETTF